MILCFSSLWFTAWRINGFELGVRRAGAHRCLQIPFPAREKARSKLPLGRHADPVAGGAKRLRDGVHEADLAGAVREAEPPRGRRGLRGDLDERPVLLDQGSDLLACEHLVGIPALVRVERHELDEANDVGLPAGELRERGHLLLREPFDGDAVHLDGAKLRVALGFLEPPEDLVEGVAARDLRKPNMRERVERDVESPQSGLDERPCEPVE